jgi:hypothetical protein
MGKLDDALNVDPVDMQLPQLSSINLPETIDSPLDQEGETEDVDADYTRKNQIELIEISKAAVNTAMRIASQSESPRAIETLAGMLKTASELNRQLVQQSKDRVEVKQAKKGVGGNVPIGQQTTNNIIMTGSLRDITKMLKDPSIINHE